MNKKVTLREIVSLRIVYALIIAMCYWMWSRSDWKNYYRPLQIGIGFFFICYFMLVSLKTRMYKKESFDELAERNLRRCDSICLKFLISAMIVTAFIGGILGHIDAISTTMVGWIIIIVIIVMAVFRAILFAIMDSKGV